MQGGRASGQGKAGQGRSGQGNLHVRVVHATLGVFEAQRVLANELVLEGHGVFRRALQRPHERQGLVRVGAHHRFLHPLAQHEDFELVGVAGLKVELLGLLLFIVAVDLGEELVVELLHLLLQDGVFDGVGGSVRHGSVGRAEALGLGAINADS